MVKIGKRKIRLNDRIVLVSLTPQHTGGGKRPPPDISRTGGHVKFILKRGEIREKLWTKNQYYAYISIFTLLLMILDIFFVS